MSPLLVIQILAHALASSWSNDHEGAPQETAPPKLSNSPVEKWEKLIIFQKPFIWRKKNENERIYIIVPIIYIYLGTIELMLH